MLRTRLHDLLLGSALTWWGCAVSPVVGPSRGDSEDPDSADELSSADSDDRSSEANSDDPSEANEPEEPDDLASSGEGDRDDDAEDADDTGPDTSGQDGDQVVRGAAQGSASGGGSVRRPAGSPGDAATSDSADAGRSTGILGLTTCSTDSDCTNSCVPVGILACCNELKTCGCTWAPGAYCL